MLIKKYVLSYSLNLFHTKRCVHRYLGCVSVRSVFSHFFVITLRVAIFPACCLLCASGKNGYALSILMPVQIIIRRLLRYHRIQRILPLPHFIDRLHLLLRGLGDNGPFNYAPRCRFAIFLLVFLCTM